jgi:UDP-N-acetylglucosamine 2-epimerase (non-hydrolysing)
VKIMSIVGARPNFMKIAPFIRALRDHPVEHILVHTGQHYDHDMSKAFFDELKLPTPDVNLGVGSGSYAYQIGSTMIEFEKALLAYEPSWVVVAGDVNATAACSVIARKHKVRVAHIEAGLRSNDWDMPEEINRVVTDRVSNLLFTPDSFADDNLLREGIAAETICRVGNIMIDTMVYERERATSLNPAEFIARNLLAPRSVSVTPGSYLLLTMHRPSNVDDRVKLAALVDVLLDLADTAPLAFPIHPRTKLRVEEFDLWNRLLGHPGVLPLKPLTYREMLHLTAGAQVVLTDSGGLQEECTVLGVPCLTLRWNTERPVTLIENGGTSRLVGNSPVQIRKGFQMALTQRRTNSSPPPLWDGHTADRVVERLFR